MSAPILSPRQAALQRVMTHAAAATKLEASDVHPGDQAPPFRGTTDAAEQVEITAWEFAGVLPVLVSATGAKYVQWATWGRTLSPLSPDLLSPQFLTQRLAEIERELAALSRGNTQVPSGLRAAFLVAIAPLEIDALLIRTELDRGGAA